MSHKIARENIERGKLHARTAIELLDKQPDPQRLADIRENLEHVLGALDAAGWNLKP